MSQLTIGGFTPKPRAVPRVERVELLEGQAAFDAVLAALKPLQRLAPELNRLHGELVVRRQKLADPALAATYPTGHPLRAAAEERVAWLEIELREVQRVFALEAMRANATWRRVHDATRAWLEVELPLGMKGEAVWDAVLITRDVYLIQPWKNLVDFHEVVMERSNPF